MGWLKLKEYGLKEAYIRKLMKEFGAYSDMFIASNFNLFSDKFKSTLEKVDKVDVSRILETHSKSSVRIISAKDNEYPSGIKKLVDFPTFLYVKGNEMHRERKIAVVGTRKVTKFGKTSCEKIVKDLLEYDITIVSGLAEGIDTIALNIAVQKNNNPIAIVGTGLDIVYPFENREIWEKIGREGTIISEYPLGTSAQKWNFPKRNRLIAAISNGVLVAESFHRGGSLITAELAYSLDKEIFAIPGFINYPSFEGCNNLIKENKAKLVTTGEDIIKEFFWEASSYKSKKANLDEDERIIYDCLTEEKSLEQLDSELEGILDSKKILYVLMILKIKGIIVETGVSKYIRIVD